ncbi:MAG: DUF4132 domain-containing protein [Ruminococcus sp.]|nr:DUF4132 domain-containing protein [Ruminococcus sp.]
MIYTNGSNKFDKLSEAMTGLGIDAETIGNIIAYIDTDNERDIKLLDKIKTIPAGQTFFYNNVTSNFFNAVTSDIKKKRDDELTQRFIIALYKLTSSDCCNYLRGAYDDANTRIKDALISEYGEDDAQVHILIALKDTKCKNTELLLKAAEITSKKSDYYSILLSSRILQEQPLPKDKKRLSDAAEKAVRIIEDYFSNHSVDISGYYIINNDLVAVGEGSFFSEKLKKLFADNIKKIDIDIVTRFSYRSSDRFLNAVTNVPGIVNAEYITALARTCLDKKEVFKRLAREFTDDYVSAITASDAPDKIRIMYDILKAEKPEIKIDIEKQLSDIKMQMVNTVAAKFDDNDASEAVRNYLLGKTTFNEIYPLIKDKKIGSYRWKNGSSYCSSYGFDELILHSIFVTLLCTDDPSSNTSYHTGISMSKKESKLIDTMMNEKIPADVVLYMLGNLMAGFYSYSINEEMSFALNALEKYPNIFSDVKPDGFPLYSRLILIDVISKNPNRNKELLLSLTSDTSKAVKEKLIPIIANSKWNDEIAALLSSKKSAIRETAVSIIEKKGAADFNDALSKALETEKSDKLKNRIAVLLGQKNISNDTAAAALSIEDEIKKLTGGNRAKKIDWVWEGKYSLVHLKDGSDESSDILKSLIMCYAPEAGIVNPIAEKFSDMLDKNDLTRFANELFGKWVEDGAAAKTKWVLYFSGVYGGSDMIDNLMYYIKYWAENMRSAIAAEAVKALALNGSSAALMNVDNMSRKFKNKQVRSAANNALLYAADQLGITKEELSDRIVPDMGFDEKMCRVFDYGKRQFNVYLTPDLEIEIFNGDKKVKSMPKPGVSDDAEIAEKSYNEFKEMKKQMKNVVSSQKARLEYVLMCDRKWTAENWKKLFVANPVMHCFAIGLIWGTYEDGKLVTTFRYLDDGSFTTSDEDEFELDENALIGLVHPIELTEDERSTWSEQLSDYEITQPFPQLSREIFTADDKELSKNEIDRFDGEEIDNQALCGRMTKYGWDKGQAQDAGWFMEFLRKDISGLKRNPDGTCENLGYIAELSFSGTYIGVFEYGSEDVTIEKLKFFKASDYKNPINIGDVNKRYFSEIILQLTNVIGKNEE